MYRQFLLNWYAFAGVHTTDSCDVILREIDRQLVALSPDRYEHMGKFALVAKRRRRRLKKARRILTDENRRAAYDAQRDAWTGRVVTGDWRGFILGARHRRTLREEYAKAFDPHVLTAAQEDLLLMPYGNLDEGGRWAYRAALAHRIQHAMLTESFGFAICGRWFPSGNDLSWYNLPCKERVAAVRTQLRLDFRRAIRSTREALVWKESCTPDGEDVIRPEAFDSFLAQTAAYLCHHAHMARESAQLLAETGILYARAVLDDALPTEIPPTLVLRIAVKGAETVEVLLSTFKYEGKGEPWRLECDVPLDQDADLPRFSVEVVPGVSPHEVAYECGTRMLGHRLLADVANAIASAIVQPPAEEAAAPAQE